MHKVFCCGDNGAAVHLKSSCCYSAINNILSAVGKRSCVCDGC